MLSQLRSSIKHLHVSSDGDAKIGAVKMISKILKTTMHLPNRIQAICWVQFWAWIGTDPKQRYWEHETERYRVVSLPVLWHDVGR